MPFYNDSYSGGGSPVQRNDDSLFLERQLEHLLPRIVEDRYQTLLTDTGAIPINTTAGAGAQSIAWAEITGGGDFKPLAGASTDLPMMHASAKKRTTAVVAHGAAFGWTLTELKRARRLNVSLNDRYLRLARRAYAERVERVALLGDPVNGVGGLLHQSMLHSGSGIPTQPFSDPIDSTTAAQTIVDNVVSWYNNVADDTDGVETPDTIAMADDSFRYIATHIIDATNRITMLEEIERLTGVDVVPGRRLRGVTAAESGLAAESDFMFCYSNDPVVLEMHIPDPFQLLPSQSSGLHIIVPVYAEISDLTVYLPKACRIAYGI